ncbi:hypothetical protein HN51_056004, partial [Arachis hypogaea]
MKKSRGLKGGSMRLDANNYETNPKLKKIREERGYSYMIDLRHIFCKMSVRSAQRNCQTMKRRSKASLRASSHRQGDMLLYFDVRNCNDGWIRVWVKKEGQIILPAGIYLIAKLFVSCILVHLLRIKGLREKVTTTLSAPPATTPHLLVSFCFPSLHFSRSSLVLLLLALTAHYPSLVIVNSGK